MLEQGHVQADQQVAARQPEKGKLSVIEAAPGSYVKKTIAEVLQDELTPAK